MKTAYKKLAKELLRAAKSIDPTAIGDWCTNWVETLVERSGIEIAPPLPVRIDGWIRDAANVARTKLSVGSKLSEAQFVISRARISELTQVPSNRDLLEKGSS